MSKSVLSKIEKFDQVQLHEFAEHLEAPLHEDVIPQPRRNGIVKLQKNRYSMILTVGYLKCEKWRKRGSRWVRPTTAELKERWSAVWSKNLR